MTLYEIDAAIESCIDPETGEVDAEKYEALTIERDIKIENTALYIKNLDAEYAALKSEKDAFAARMESIDRKRKAMRERLAAALNGEPFKTTRAVISFRTSESLVIDDITAIPAEYLKQKDPDADKNAIKAAIKAGAQIGGAHIESRMNMNIK